MIMMANHLVLHFAFYLSLASLIQDTAVEGKYQNKFGKIRNATIDGRNILQMSNNTVEKCAVECYRSDMCTSFVFDNMNSKCDYYGITTHPRSLRSLPNLDFYYLRKQTKCCPMSIVYGAVLPKDKIFSEQNLSFTDCVSTCYNDSLCKTVNYNMKSNTCLMSKYTSDNATVMTVNYNTESKTCDRSNYTSDTVTVLPVNYTTESKTCDRSNYTSDNATVTTVNYTTESKTCDRSDYTSDNVTVLPVNYTTESTTCDKNTVSVSKTDWQYIEFDKNVPLGDGIAGMVKCHPHHFPKYHDTAGEGRLYRKEFIKIGQANFGEGTIRRMYSVSVEECAENCDKSKKCKSFQFYTNMLCDLLKFHTRDEILMFRGDADFYQRRVEPKNKCCPMSIVYGAVLPKDKIFSEQNLSFTDCVSTCYNDSWCKTVNYNRKSNTCFTSNYTNDNATILNSLQTWLYIEFLKYLPLKIYPISEGGLGIVNCYPVNFPMYENDTLGEGRLYRNKFMKISNATLNSNSLRVLDRVSVGECEEECYKQTMFTSFTLEKSISRCKLYVRHTSIRRLGNSLNIEFYQRKLPSSYGYCPLGVVRGAVLPEDKTISERIPSYTDCLFTCYNDSWCNTVNYNTLSKTCLMSNYTNDNATISVTQEDWLYVEFDKSIPFIKRVNVYGVVEPKYCYFPEFYKFYIKNEERSQTSTVQTGSYTKSLTPYTFTRPVTSYFYLRSSRIGCAAKCEVYSKCYAFRLRYNFCYLEERF